HDGADRFLWRPTRWAGNARYSDANARTRPGFDSLRHRQRRGFADGAMLPQQIRRHAEQLGFCLVRVHDHRLIYIARTARYVSQARRDQSARARLGYSNPQPSLYEEIADHGFAQAAIGPVEISSEDRHRLRDGRLE